ncbi:MAG: metallophosphoesterase [Humibacillus sp.]|nr:metallophosphoesterase [Humibacillus sp.]
MGSLAPRPAPTHVIAHLSDPHLLAGDRLLSGHIDTAAQFRQALSRVEESKEAIDAIVLSGDLTDSADPNAYALLLEIARPVADRLGAALVMTGGNHDERRPLAVTLYGADTDAPQDRVTDVRGLRLITLDSAVPGYHHGGLSDDQYDWLAGELATPAEYGTILVMHHPPITYRSPTMAMLDFDDPARLGRVLAGNDVRAILSGHLHVTTFGTLSGIPVIVAGGVSYVDDVAAPRELMIGLDGPQSWNLVELHAGGGGEIAGEVVASVAPVTRHPGWPALSEAVRDYMASVPAGDRREVFSRKRS